MTITRTAGRAGRSKAVQFDGTMTCVATAPETTSTNMKVQTEQALAVIDECLAEAGTNKSKLLNTTVYLADMSRWNEMQEAWTAWVDPDNCPTRAIAGVELLPGFLVEIVATAEI
ncbi:MAG: RidA family protein [Rhodospirillales bacterium]|nr:RidA family protein [Rhodospirillales bacterium]MDP7650330.1 RidA family protein [Rhodospirillales bacterium]HJO97172.1 RidA family protein [Rhodospirillales bacterium]